MFQPISHGHYDIEDETVTAQQWANRALNSVVTSGAWDTHRPGKEWEEPIIRKELARYLRGDLRPPALREGKADESLRAKNARLADETLRLHLWLQHGPGIAGVGHEQTAHVGALFRATRDALNDSVRRIQEQNVAKQRTAALRAYGKVPSMRALINGEAVAYRQAVPGGGSVVNIIQPRGPLGANGLPVDLYHLGAREPYDTRTAPLWSIYRATEGADHVTYLRALSSNWRPVTSNRGAIGQAASAYREHPTPENEARLLDYTGGTSSGTKARASRAKKSA